VNLLGDNMDTIKKITETLIDARKEVGLEINVEKTNCTLYYFRQATRSSETFVYNKSARRHVLEDGILQIKI
jgi:hypothetical protein